MASLFREPAAINYVDRDNSLLGSSGDDRIVPRVGENIRIADVPYVVERVGYDMPRNRIEVVWVVCRPA